MSGAARRLDKYHVHMGVGSEWLTSGPLVLRAVLNCVLGQRCHVQICIPVSIRAGVPAAHRRAGGGLAEEGAVPTLEGRKEGGRESEKESKMSDVGI